MSLDDHDRPLNKRGHHAAPLMGARMKQKNLYPDLMITSTARRAQDTCSYIAGELNYSEKDIQTDSRLYHASSREILDVIQQVDSRVNVLYIFGHNPGFTSFANLLNQTDIQNIPTAGIVVCELAMDSWEETSFGIGKQLAFDYPKKPKE
jgi:phosphohistidine phosphatase